VAFFVKFNVIFYCISKKNIWYFSIWRVGQGCVILKALSQQWRVPLAQFEFRVTGLLSL
jgi:hypothetical protein